MLECCKGKPLNPVILEMIDKDTEVLFNLLVDSFSFSVCLGVKGCWCIAFDLQQIIKILHEFGDKLDSSLWDDDLGHAVFSINFVM